LNTELFIVLGGYFRTHNGEGAITKKKVEGSGMIKTLGQRRKAQRRSKEDLKSDGTPINEENLR
jgi:hypothetical protein